MKANINFLLGIFGGEKSNYKFYKLNKVNFYNSEYVEVKI